jgi:PAS domain S-box-containing protein
VGGSGGKEQPGLPWSGNNPVQPDATAEHTRETARRRSATPGGGIRLTKRFQAVLDAAPDAMVLTDRDGGIVVANAEAERLFCYASGELLGRPVELLIPRLRVGHPEPRRESFSDPRTRLMGEGHTELSGVRKNGAEFPVEISLSPLETEDGLMAMTAIRDISERRRLEEERSRMHARTRELEELKTKFFANLSHELRTPLALILGPAERLLNASSLAENERRDLDVILRNARTLLKHVNDLLDVSKIEAGKMRPEYAECDISRLLRFVAGHFDGIAQDRSIVYGIDVPERLTAQVDPDQLQRVVLNLLSNAFKFTPEHGVVRCSASVQAGGRLRLEIADSGPGVPPEQRHLVFERFRQVDTGIARTGNGTGLGLAIARDFTLLHGGAISVTDAREGGALFVVELPMRAPEGTVLRSADLPLAAGDEVGHVVDAVRRQVEMLRDPARADRPLVLVVEDNPQMNRFVRELLQEDYRVESAFDGEEGLAKALALHPDLILSDLMMPKMSGDRMVRKMREEAGLADVPIVLLTAKADDDLRIRLLREGAQDYLMKPFSGEEMKARIGNLISMKNARDVLQRELYTSIDDLAALAREAAARKRELQTALFSVQVAREHAERASRLKSDFLGMVSHELRTPITALQLQLERLRRDQAGLSGDQRNLFTRMGGSTGRLAELVDSLLQYSRLESGRITTRSEAFDLADVANHALDEVRLQAERKNLTIGLRSSARSPATLVSDPELVRLILVNLLMNAIKFTDRGGIEVSVESAHGTQRVLVADTGRGIRVEDQARIFEPFEQVQSMRNKSDPGVGLGLALVREMTKALGGLIEVTSEVGKGSTFSVILPVGRSEASRLYAR